MWALTQLLAFFDVLFTGWCLPLWSECSDPPAASATYVLDFGVGV